MCQDTAAPPYWSSHPQLWSQTPLMSPDRHVVLPLSIHSLAVSDNYCTLYTCCSNVHCLHILCHYLFHTHKNENDQRELPHAPHTTPLTCPSVSAPEPAAPGWGGDILFPSPNTFSRALLHKISPLPPVSSVFFSLLGSHRHTSYYFSH